MKYRRNKVKREHGIIQDALEWLEELGKNPEVSDIIPGVIEISRSPERGLVYKYETATGCKLLLKSNGTIQEAFVVTKNPEWVRTWVENRFPVSYDHEQTGPAANTAKRAKGQGRNKENKSEQKTRPQRTAPAGRRNQRAQNGEGEPGWAGLGELDAPKLGEQLDSSTRQALRSLQKSLKSRNTAAKK